MVFWERTAPPVRAVFIATALELVIGIGLFLVEIPLTATGLGMPPIAVIFGPVPFGTALIELLYFVAIIVGVQLAVAFALGRRTAWLRTVGTLGAFVFAGFCLLYIVVVGLAIGKLVLTGSPIGDIQDLRMMILFVPVFLAIGVLNGGAALGTIRGSSPER
jgi:hypothetical protein